MSSIDHFRTLQRMLKSKGVFHNPQLRESSVTLRGLPHTTPRDEIKEDLESIGITPGHVTPQTRMTRRLSSKDHKGGLLV